MKLDPYAPELIQPSSIDVRLDRYFRVFENHRYPHIDPAIEQPDLTRLVETNGEEPFVLHPGEFVLASTYEIVTLPVELCGGLRRQVAAQRGRMALRHRLPSRHPVGPHTGASTPPKSRPRLLRGSACWAVIPRIAKVRENKAP